MSDLVLSHAVLQELQRDLGSEDIQRGLHRLSEVVDIEGESLMSSDAKAQWSSIGVRADAGRGTLVQRRGGATLLVVALSKAVQIAASARSDRTMGDILRSYPGVAEHEAPRVNARGGRVWTPELPDATSSKTP